MALQGTSGAPYCAGEKDVAGSAIEDEASCVGRVEHKSPTAGKRKRDRRGEDRAAGNKREAAQCVVA